MKSLQNLDGQALANANIQIAPELGALSRSTASRPAFKYANVTSSSILNEPHA
jgi:hypothetical protein